MSMSIFLHIINTKVNIYLRNLMEIDFNDSITVKNETVG